MLQQQCVFAGNKSEGHVNPIFRFNTNVVLKKKKVFSVLWMAVHASKHDCFFVLL